MSDRIITKRCSACKQIKPLSEFYKHKNRTDGHQTSCKECDTNYCREKIKKQKYRIHRRIYRKTERGKEIIRKSIKKYKQKNIDKIKKYAKRYYWSNLNKSKAKYTVYKSIRKRIISLASCYHCRYCWNQAEQYHHHLGYAKEHWLDVQPVCKSCHGIIHNQRSFIVDIR